MKSLSRFVVTLLLIFAFLSNALPCGPGYITPLFDTTSAPENPYSDFAAGRLGIVKPTFRRSVLYAAYRYIAGSGLNAPEQQAMIEVWKAEIDNNDFRDDSIDEAVKAWVDKRKDVVGKEEKTPDIYVERTYGGYDFFPNCTKNAFETAAETLADRAANHGPNDTNVTNWVTGQDQVFQNCSAGKQTPDAAPPGAPDWLQKDRAYQKAAAEFYSLDYTAAKRHFAEIAQDTESPWQETADYLVARTLIRQASLSKTPEKAASYYDEAETHLEKFVSRSGKFSGSSERLIDLIKYRLRPKERVSELAKVLSVNGGNENFRQDVIDYNWLLDKLESEVLSAEEKRKEQAELARFAESDNAISKTILENISRLGLIVNVSVVKGEATLSGRVPKEKASEVLAAANQASPKSLINHLTLVSVDSNGQTTYEGQGGFELDTGVKMAEFEQKRREEIASGEIFTVSFDTTQPSTNANVGTSSSSSLTFKVTESDDDVYRQIQEMLNRPITELDKEKVRNARQEAYRNKTEGVKSSGYEGGYYGDEEMTRILMPDFLRQDDLTDWLFTFRMKGAEAYLYSLQKFRESGSELWLMTALSKADKSSTQLPRLLEAANNASRTSPAYPTIAFHTARILLDQGKTAEARKLIDEMLNSGDELPISARNTFVGLRLNLAETLEDFLKYSLKKPYAFNFDGQTGSVDEIIAEQKTYYDPEYNKDGREAFDAEVEDRYKNKKLWQDRLMFDSETFAAMNQHFPLPVLVEVEKSKALPDYLRERFAVAIWTRAVLLADQATADKIAPEVIKYRPEFEPFVTKILDTRSPAARQNATLFFILKNPLLSPYLEEGLGKTDNEFGNFDSNDWWCSSYESDSEEAAPDEYGQKPAPRPKFLTAAQSQAAKLERKKLKDIGDAPAYLAAKVLDWAKRYPTDRRVPESLYIVFEANGWTKYGCGNNTELHDEIAAYLRKHYPNSEWTAKIAEEESEK